MFRWKLRQESVGEHHPACPGWRWTRVPPSSRLLSRSYQTPAPVLGLPTFFFPSVGTERGALGGKQSWAGSRQGHLCHEVVMSVSQRQAGTQLSPRVSSGASEKHSHLLQRGRVSSAPGRWPGPGVSVHSGMGHVGAKWPHGCWAAPVHCQESLSARCYYSPILPLLPAGLPALRGAAIP